LEVLPEISASDLGDFSEELLDEMAKLEPFGEGNVEPIFGLSRVRIEEARPVGKDGKHLRMVVSDERGRKMTLVAFSAPEEWLTLESGVFVSVTVQLTRNEWNGKTSVEGRILGVEKITGF
jgi:single-stranded-DNA-specific exonuclease